MPPICPPHKILNPVTGRCVSRTGAIGRRLVECPNGQIRNPATGRCVNRDGPVGKRILRQQGGQAQPPIRPIPGTVPGQVVNRMTKSQVLALIRELCWNTEDPISFDEWENLNVTQLRTIVRLLDNGGVDFFGQRTEPLRPVEHHPRSHCFLLQNIKRWVQAWIHRFGQRTILRHPPKHPVTNVPLTQGQIDALLGLGRRRR